MAGENHRRLLPEILQEILYRVPIKSLNLFWCVSKSWQSLISTNNDFIRKHHTTQSDKLFEKFLTPSNPMDLLDGQLPLSSLKTMHTGRNGFLFGEVEKNYAKLITTCDGLLCVCDYWSVYIWNPGMTSSYRKIFTFTERTFFKFGLGYDSIRDDYKLLKLSRKSPRKPFKTEIYSLKTGMWEKVDDFPQKSFPYYDTVLFANGAIHWLDFRQDSSSYVFISFDLAENKYVEVPLPEDQVMPHDPCRVKPYALRGMLCVHIIGPNSLVLWVRKDYKNKRSWSRILEIPCDEVVSYGLRSLFDFKPLYLYENGEVLIGAPFWGRRGRREVSDIELLICKDSRVVFRQIRQISSYYMPVIQEDGFVHVDSLISPLQTDGMGRGKNVTTKKKRGKNVESVW